MSLSVKVKKNLGAFTLDAEWSIDNELAVLFGYSGSGKSLTLQMIAGLVRPDEGSIRMNNRTMFDSASRISIKPQSRSFGYVFQDLALFPHVTVRENILYGACGLGRVEREKRADEMIERFQLAGLEHKLPGSISGGQKQRVALARAVIRRPEALLLDEPFSALDAPLRLEMQDLLKDIRREYGIPVILITHDLAEACFLADKLIVYADGKVAQIAAPSRILSAPANPCVARLFACGRSRSSYLHESSLGYNCRL
jgi:molybdate transport system ATP-binding protein